MPVHGERASLVRPLRERCHASPRSGRVRYAEEEGEEVKEHNEQKTKEYCAEDKHPTQFCECDMYDEYANGFARGVRDREGEAMTPPPVAGECVVTTSRSHMCSYCGDSGVYGAPPPAPVARKEKHWSELPPETPPAAVPQAKVVMHLKLDGWDRCVWLESERPRECVDFESKPYEHASFLPASAVADAVRGHRQLLGECYEAIEKAIEDEDGLDGSEGAPLLKAISEILK